MFLYDETDIIANREMYRPICGIYFLIHEKKVIYVGQSTNIMKRLYEHKIRKSFKRIFTSYFIVECDSSELTRLEYAYIKKISPSLNIQGGN